CSSYVVEEFKKTGAKVTRLPQKEIGNLYIAEYPASRSKEKQEQILLLTHIDTVWPVGKINKMPFYVTENKVFGPGALDMKASLVMAIFSLKALNELNIQPKKKIVVFLNSAEEIGSEKSYEVIRDLSKKSACVLCLEPSLPGGDLKIQRKGRLVIRLEAKGKAAHAGTPDKGVNAIKELIQQLHQLQKLETKETTINIGLIGGGEKPNIVAENAWTILDIRFWNNIQKERILKFLKQLNPLLKGAKIKFLIESFTPSMEKTEVSTDLLTQIRRIASSLNMKLGAGKTGGGSDASIASSLGVPTLDGLGPDGEGIHADNEHLLLSSLVERTALLTEILMRL
ncbi:MAG: M20 family metallopeptidase, partial [Candidatus Aminicenantes bacterium]|nr:M20 family metallopeptidase [Candidatus Aminicenantes bacterium]